jgi:hypothetical protein
MALLWLGEHQGSTKRLEEAVTAFRAALNAHTRDRVPRQWASISASLSQALLKLGKKRNDVETLYEARRAAANSAEVFASLKDAGQEAKARETFASIEDAIQALD